MGLLLHRRASRETRDRQAEPGMEIARRQEHRVKYECKQTGECEGSKRIGGIGGKQVFGFGRGMPRRAREEHRNTAKWER